MLLMSSVTVMAQGDWVKQSIDGRASIKFPKTPEKVPDADAYYYTGPDSIKYVVNVTDLGELGLDSATLAEMTPTDEFLDQMKMGMTMQMPGIEFSKSAISTWKNYTVYDFEGYNKTDKANMFIKTVFVGSKMYVLLNIVPEKKTATGKDTFFNNFTL